MVGRDKKIQNLTIVARRHFLAKPSKGKRKPKRQRRREEGGGPPVPPGAPGARTYLLAAAAAGVGLGVRRRAAAAPGRGVKVPGIVLVHDPRWGPERKQGACVPPPSPLRARRPRAAPGLRALLSGFAPTAAGAGREAATPGSGAPGSCTSRPAPRARRERLSSRVPPSKKSARPWVPPLRAPSRPRAQPEPGRDRRPARKLDTKKGEEPGESRLPGLGGSPRGQAGRKK